MVFITEGFFEVAIESWPELAFYVFMYITYIFNWSTLKKIDGNNHNNNYVSRSVYASIFSALPFAVVYFNDMLIFSESIEHTLNAKIFLTVLFNSDCILMKQRARLI